MISLFVVLSLFCLFLFCTSFVAASLPGIPGLTLLEPLPMDCTLFERNFSRENPTLPPPFTGELMTTVEFEKSSQNAVANMDSEFSFFVKAVDRGCGS